MTQDDSFPAGTRIGNYEVMSRLGRGGMGVVYLVQQVFLHKRFALKVLNADLAELPEFVEVFRQEARTLAALRHANIVQVHDFGEHEGRSYFLMDYIDGGTVEDRRRLRGGRLDPADVLQLLLGLTAGLAYAHGIGIVHRDLKPENFLIDAEGVSKITDFGLATLVRNPTSVTTAGRRGDTFLHFARDAQSAPALTGGTEGYMAPELREGGAADSRSDVYAMGVIAYQLLTGKLPAAESASVTAEVPGIDARWDAVIARCLSVKPSDRFEHGAALHRALRDLDGARARPAAIRGAAWLWALPVPLLSVTVFVAALAWHAPAPVVAGGRPRRAVTGGDSPPAHRSAEIRFRPADAELGYGLVLQGTPPSIAGWKPASRAIWPFSLRPGRYRVSCLCGLTPVLGEPPVQLTLRAGDSRLRGYLPVIPDDSGMTRVRLGEMELSSTVESVEVELTRGAASGVNLRLGPLYFEPVF